MKRLLRGEPWYMTINVTRPYIETFVTRLCDKTLQDSTNVV